MTHKGEESLKDFVTSIGAVFYEAWFYMLGLGILHGTYHQVPAAGYWTGVVLAVFFAGGGATRYAILRRVKKLTGEER